MNKKTKFFAVALTALALFMGVQANAQSIQKGKLQFGVGVDGLVPVANLTNTTNFGLGVTPNLQYGITDKIALTFTSGIYHFFPKDLYFQFQSQSYKYHNKLDLIPVKAGIKVFIASHIYVAGEAGLGFQVDSGHGDSKFLASGGIGYASKHWDVGLRYENFSANSDKNGLFGLRVAYGFSL